jgi:hypothetical protein
MVGTLKKYHSIAGKKLSFILRHWALVRIKQNILTMTPAVEKFLTLRNAIV